jgi:hypothetical protein
MTVNDIQDSPPIDARPPVRRSAIGRRLAGLAVAPALAALLVACGSDGSNTADPADLTTADGPWGNHSRG